MGDFGANDAEVRGRACGFTVAGQKEKKAKQLREGLWQQATAKAVLQVEGTQPLRTDVDRRHAKVTEWVDLRLIF